jgi:hypothetical protein
VPIQLKLKRVKISALFTEKSATKKLKKSKPNLSDSVSSRAGLTLFAHYLSNIMLHPHLERLFGGTRKSMKGQLVVDIFK